MTTTLRIAIHEDPRRPAQHGTTWLPANTRPGSQPTPDLAPSQHPTTWPPGNDHDMFAAPVLKKGTASGFVGLYPRSDCVGGGGSTRARGARSNVKTDPWKNQ